MQDTPVTLPQMLAARERRAIRQMELLRRFPGALISFTMNIAGPVKRSARIERGYEEGLRLIRLQLRMSGVATLHFEERRDVAGCEAFFATDAEPRRVKRLMTALEDENGLGRLFDIDVLKPDGEKVSRTETGGEPRRCLICDQPAAVCGSRRLHTVGELQARTAELIDGYFERRFCDIAAELAQRSLLYEVCVTPKPGLVDRAGSGSHSDMDIYTFCRSAASLFPYFRECAASGIRTAALSPEAAFDSIVPAGRRAEAEMERATGGVNTHKGAIYSMGTLCAALGRRFGLGLAPDAEASLLLCGDLTRASAERSFEAMRRMEPATAGHRLFARYGIRGIRGEVAEGFPSVRSIALPALNAALDAGRSPDSAGSEALLRLLSAVTDTNMIARSGIDAAQAARAQAEALLAQTPDDAEALRALGRQFEEKRLSPGGCADLLSVAWMARFIDRELRPAFPPLS